MSGVKIMRPLSGCETSSVSGAILYYTSGYMVVPSTDIPANVFKNIERCLQNLIDGIWGANACSQVLKDWGCDNYMGTYLYNEEFYGQFVPY